MRSGPKHWLDNKDNLRLIRKLVIADNSWSEIAKEIGLSIRTIEDWLYDNDRNFKDLSIVWKHQRMLNKAENKIEELQSSEEEKITLDANKFVLKTLGKKTYSEKQEIDVSGDLSINIVSYKDEEHNDTI